MGDGLIPPSTRATEAMDVEALYRRYGAMVRRRCLWMLRDDLLAADATQDVFVAMIRRGPFAITAPGPLLQRIATNVCLNALRSRGRRPEDADEDLLLRIAAIPDHSGPIEARSVLDRLFGRERESSRTIAVLHLLDGYTLEEVAATTGMSVSGVRKRLRGLRTRLRELEDLP